MLTGHGPHLFVARVDTNAWVLASCLQVPTFCLFDTHCVFVFPGEAWCVLLLQTGSPAAPVLIQHHPITKTVCV